jgi:hypothetical protein
MSELRRPRPNDEDTVRAGEDPAPRRDTDRLWTEEPATIREDEQEVYDLGFIVENHDDRRAASLGCWQRLETLDTDEALETDPAGPLPEEAELLRNESALAAGQPDERPPAYAGAERSEEEFARSNHLLLDPEASDLPPVAADMATILAALRRASAAGAGNG